MHERQHVNDRADRIAHEHEDDQVREPAHSVSAANVVGAAEHREAQWSFEDIRNALTHLGEEPLPETGDFLLVASRGLVELLLGLRLDVEPVHLARSLASIRSNTSSAGRPFDSPARTRPAPASTPPLP